MTKTEQIKRLLDQGLDRKTIAEKVGCSRQYVGAVKNRLRNKARTGQQEYPATVSRLKRRYAEDLDFRETIRARKRLSAMKWRARAAAP